MAASAGNETMPAEGASTQTVTGGAKPLHRFLRVEPKAVGIVLMFMGSCLFMFGVPMKMDVVGTSADLYSSFWLGILYFTCGVLYVLAEREPTKKIITASLALSIISTLGSIVAAIEFIRAIVQISVSRFIRVYGDDYTTNYTSILQGETAVDQHYMALYSLEAVFLFNSLLGGVILITMTVFARMALRSTRTQTVVVMRSLPSAE